MSEERSDFKKWFEANVYWKFPGDPYENSFTVLLRLADAMAKYIDEEVDRLRQNKDGKQ